MLSRRLFGNSHTEKVFRDTLECSLQVFVCYSCNKPCFFKASFLPRSLSFVLPSKDIIKERARQDGQITFETVDIDGAIDYAASELIEQVEIFH